MLEVSIKPVVGFRALQLVAKGSAVADRKVSRIVCSQDTHGAWYERRNDRRVDCNRFTDDVGTAFELRGEHKHVRASQQVQSIVMSKRSQPLVARIGALLGFYLCGKLRVKHSASVLHLDPGRSWQVTHGIRRSQGVLDRSQVRQYANL